MTAGSLIDRLRLAGATLTCSSDGRVRFVAPSPLPTGLLAEARHHREAIARVLADEGPETACERCSGCLFWRLSVLSGGPGPWTCQPCAPPASADWIDACSLPVTQIGDDFRYTLIDEIHLSGCENFTTFSEDRSSDYWKGRCCRPSVLSGGPGSRICAQCVPPNCRRDLPTMSVDNSGGNWWIQARSRRIVGPLPGMPGF